MPTPTINRMTARRCLTKRKKIDGEGGCSRTRIARGLEKRPMVNSDFVRILSSEVRQRKMAIGSDGDGGGWLFAAPSNRELNEVLPTRRPSVEWRQVRCATKPVRSNQTGQRQRKNQNWMETAFRTISTPTAEHNNRITFNFSIQ
ncbi:hypothetical protein OOU_Y34scaffold00765g59 [Pyricularia oryzae Y34]|uniref:Uncharacterized protein n=1 Tax=Pyricularia oryzae (strain Y34) TaxID=1143189 RepID=A0AA97NQJ1_PYRO3|nr:hypothetical protein OOU_Y34scaffold00765g59 [Pyricularia oryzae Y34]